ncbi:MAG TPA: hypothetical protein VJC39_03895 [Candidatus Nanoarchaeia archaeon]|nr:hypothetical protein [Candidatus Nanoarchaeia archaeon]
MKTKFFSKIILILFLIMIVLGFVIPGFINSSPIQSGLNLPEPRLCQSDADCYLSCDDSPVSVLCSNNLCLQNSCEEQSYYLYNLNPLTFSLAVEAEGTVLDLASRANTNDYFIQFSGMQVKVFTDGLFLNHILEKVNLKLAGACLSVDNTQYCNGDQGQLKLTINGEDSAQLGDYLPKEGDKLELKYRPS